jgi:hypothetical protein
MRLRVLCLPAAFVGLALLPGCGGSSMAPVHGHMTWDGKPVKEAAIVFSPAPRSDKDKEPGKPATAFSDENGNYVLSTFKSYDGALIGSHNVTISLDATNPAKCKRSTRITLEVRPGDNELNIVLE